MSPTKLSDGEQPSNHDVRNLLMIPLLLIIALVAWAASYIKR